MVPVLFMPAVMAAEQVGAGRGPRTVAGSYWRIREPSSRATPTRWQATATNFFGWRTSGEAQAAALAAHRGVWSPRGLRLTTPGVPGVRYPGPSQNPVAGEDTAGRLVPLVARRAATACRGRCAALHHLCS
jgi:hypothetical protein